jgi:hypothetical protein
MSEFDAAVETAAGMRDLPRRMGQPGAAIRLAAAGPAGQPGGSGDTDGLSRNPHPANPFMMPLLSLAVIEDLNEVRRMAPSKRAASAAKAADVLAGGFDFIARDERPRGGREGRETFHAVWRAMVRGIAIGSLQAGGITVLGQHFDATKWPYSSAGDSA